MTKNKLEAFHCQLYHQWCKDWYKDMQKNYSDKRKIKKK